MRRAISAGGPLVPSATKLFRRYGVFPSVRFLKIALTALFVVVAVIGGLFAAGLVIVFAAVAYLLGPRRGSSTAVMPEGAPRTRPSHPSDAIEVAATEVTGDPSA